MITAAIIVVVRYFEYNISKSQESREIEDADAVIHGSVASHAMKPH